MYSAVGTSAEITALVTQFLPGQLAYANQIGIQFPEVFAAQQLGLVFAFHNESGSTTFANNFGPSNSAMPNTAGGDAAFAAAANTAIFGSAATPTLQAAILGYVDFLKGFFTAHGIVGVSNANADQIDQAARAGAWGDAIAIAIDNHLGPIASQTINFLKDAAQGTAVYGASLASQPTAAPFQGAAGPAITAMGGDAQLVGVNDPIDHAYLR
jgi:hypothetical protein